MLAFVFPGQGSQAVGMGKAVAEAFTEARQVFEEIDDTLNQKLSKIIFEGPQETLTETQNTQPALFAVSMAVLRVLQKQGKIQPAFVAGHSLGEYSALAAAGVIDVRTATQLLRQRGQSMQQAVPLGQGAMSAVLGLDHGPLSEVVTQAAQGEVCVIANDNAPGQIVISGHAAAVARAGELATAAGAKRVVPLPVSGPFHSPLMAPAADVMRKPLEMAHFNIPSIPVVTNVTAQAETNANLLKDLLIQQITGQVRWRETVMHLAAKGVTRIVEVGAGKVLTGLGKRIAPDLAHDSVHTPEEIDTLLQSL